MFGLRVSTLLAKTALLIMLVGIGVGGVWAEPLFQFHTLTKKDGLASTVVSDLVQDNNGFVWLATEDGLQKYDGFTLKTYRHNRSEPGSISNNVVKTLMIDKSGQLWIGTDNGLNIYSKRFDNFERIVNDKDDSNSIASNQIRTIFQSSDGNIWVGTSSGLSQIAPKSKKIRNFIHHKVRAIHEDNHKKLWVGTLGEGLFLFDRHTEKFRTIQTPLNEQENTRSISIVDLFQDTFGRILVATWGNGVFQINRDNLSLEKFPLDLPSKYVRNIHQDQKGQLWFGTKNGLLVYKPAEKLSRKIIAMERNESSLRNNNITAIYQGNENTIWIGTYGGGVSRYFPASSRFENYGIHHQLNEGLIDPVVSALSENKNGKIWIGTETGKVSLFDPVDKTFTHFDLSEFSEIENFNIFSILEVRPNIIVIATANGLFKYFYNQGKLERFTQAESSALAAGFPVRFVKIDIQNRVWIGINNYGVVAFNVLANGTFEQINGTYFEVNDPKAMVFHSDERAVLAGMNSGIYILFLENEESPTIKSVEKLAKTSGLSILDISVDWKGRIWLATLSNGIKIINRRRDFNTLDEVNGLPNNNVYSIIPDVISNKIWATTNAGMVSIHHDSLQITHYTSSDGLQNDEFNAAGMKSSRGYLYFAGVNGFNRFYPNIIENEVFVRPPSIIGLSIANKKIPIKQNGVLENSLLVAKEIILRHNQTPFSLEFTSPQYVKPADLRFRYRLRGLSDEWISSSDNIRLATYTNINAGDYDFELQVGNSFGWNDEIRKLKITITPPWWLTVYAKLVYIFSAILFVAIVMLLVYKRRKKEKLIQIAVLENEERLKLSLWGSGYEFWDWNLETGDISRSNEFKKIEIDCPKLSKNLNELASYVHPNDLQMVREKLSNHIAGNTNHFDICYRVVDAQNGWRWIQDRGKVVAIDGDGNALRMSGTQRDITDIRERDAQFEMLGQAFKSTSDGVWIRDHEWRLVECNPAYERITGFSLGEKKGEALWFPEIQEQPENLIQRIRISIEEKGNWQGEAWAERKNNDPFPQKLSIDTLHDEKGNIRYYVGVFSDITFHKRTEEEFRKLANYDSLTGLPNRACLYDRLNQTIEKTKRDKGRFALFLIDVDNFKRINDSLGHNVGDHLIRQVASRLVNCNKEGDTVARIGGDEFVIVVENIRSSTSVATFSELLLKELNQPIFVKGQKLKLNFSIGITLAPDDAIVAERLMRNADTAMYEAKKSVQNSYRFYSVEFNERARKRLALETALRKAIEDETIELFYQPKVDLSTGRVDGVEALARWTHKELGFISPADFIPLAEETGLIIPLGHQLLRAAIRQTNEWVRAGVMRGRTSVNLSAHQFWNRNLASEASQMLDDEGLDAKYIELEITESACMQDIEETKTQIQILKDLGFSLALDDFGTGYSSLAQLKSLPFDTLKVDKSFVDNIESEDQDAKVVKAIIDIAKSMEMNVVIEGVESKSQCEYLWLNRAYIVQGFYFSRPVRSNLCTEIFARKWHQQEYLGALSSNVTPLT